MSHHGRDWEGQLARAGYRVTRQRATILDAVCSGHGHTTLSDVHGRVRRADPAIDRSTVYRAMRTFVAAGIVVAADTGGAEPVYEIAHPEPHHHLVCRHCGVETEIDGDALRGLAGDLMGRYGFSLHTDHLVLAGVCARCQVAGHQPVVGDAATVRQDRDHTAGPNDR